MKVTSLSLSHTHTYIHKCYIIHENSYTNRQKENRIQTHKHKTHSTTMTKQTTKHTYASSSITKLQNTHTKRQTQPSKKTEYKTLKHSKTRTYSNSQVTTQNFLHTNNSNTNLNNKDAMQSPKNYHIQ
ncbi:unnamed protein product [Brassica rapa subsp. trilocularis]